MSSGVVSKNLFECFNAYNDLDFVFVEPGGNFGDSIIYKGAYKLAALAELTFKIVKFDEFMASAHYPDDTVIYIHGGGGINSFWSGKPIKALKKAVSTHRGTVILGPQTFQTNEEFLSQFVMNNLEPIISESVYLFCREKCSYECLKRFTISRANVVLDHDTALNLNSDDFTLDIQNRSDILYCIRSDKEQNPTQEYAVLSKWIDPITCSRNMDDWLSLHANASEIITNRLHSAVLAVILDIPVTLLPNNYFKNQAVWEYSLRQRGVLWHDNIPVGKFNRRLSRIHSLNHFRHSKLCQRLIRRVLI